MAAEAETESAELEAPSDGGPATPPPGSALKYPEFCRRFGAFRSKNLNSPLDPRFAKTKTNRRVHLMSWKPEIPREFIRLDPWEAEYLFIVAQRAKSRIVETGRFNGGSVLLMGCANPSVPIHSIDIKPQDDERLRQIFATTGYGGNVELIVGDSQNERYPHIEEVDLLFIDGDHSYEGCTRDLENWYGGVARGGHVVLHDCYNGSPVMDSIIDFTAKRDVRFLTNPYSVADHWTNATGSMAHFIKLDGERDRRRAR